MYVLGFLYSHVLCVGIWRLYVWTHFACFQIVHGLCGSQCYVIIGLECGCGEKLPDIRSIFNNLGAPVIPLQAQRGL